MKIEEKNKEYETYLNNLFKDCSIKIYEISLTSNSIFSGHVEDETNSMFKKLSEIYNKNVAKNYLSKLSEMNPEIEDKIKNYPTIYWNTPQGENEVIIFLRNQEKVNNILCGFQVSNEMDEFDKETICKDIEKKLEIIKKIDFEKYFQEYTRQVSHIFSNIVNIQNMNKESNQITCLEDDKLSLEIINGLKDIKINIKSNESNLKFVVESYIKSVYIHNVKKQKVVNKY